MHMPRQARSKSESGIYHVILRGANRQEIFHDDDDNRKLLEILARYKTKSQFSIFAWCLMSNHVHLLVKEGNESLSNTMKRIGVSYVSYYNWKYRANGHLFQDRFGSENVETNRYLLTVIRYIHQNPVKAGIASKVDEWKWSSCLEYYGKDKDQWNLVNNQDILGTLSVNIRDARTLFKEFNEMSNQDQCLDEHFNPRISDDEARIVIKELISQLEIAHVKSLPRVQRNEVLRKLKKIEGLSQRRIARILGVSVNLVFRA
jgi:putative transposase